ncbi:MAG TPA: thiamine-phosphate kinase [Quisquiliibacterium sp.]|nr:thiamine-phosphate kinase [Quisquiliibacterium sp.]
MSPHAHRVPDAPGGGLREFDLIRRYFDRGPTRRAALGIGDDCALLAPAAGCDLAVSTDMLVAGTHFFEDVDPEALGHKALAVNLSDLAAMGARPLAFTLALALPRADESWLGAFSRGLFALADRHGCELVGGDTTRGPLNVCITVFGEVPHGAALRRDHAEPGDDLWLSGCTGEAAHALRCRLQGRPLAAGDPAQLRLDRPEPRVALGLFLRHLARAAIDVSDGLLGDLAHVCRRSRVGAEIDAASVPMPAALRALPPGDALRLALAGGDDYELLFTAAPENRAALAACALPHGLTRIGRIVPGEDVRVLDARGARIDIDVGGYEHFGA